MRGRAADLRPHPIPFWMSHSKAYLHDAVRNLQPLEWAIKESLAMQGIVLTSKESSFSAISKVQSPKLKNLLNLLGKYDELQNKIVSFSKKRLVTGLDEQAISLVAKEMLSVATDLRDSSGFLKQTLAGKDEEHYYDSYMENFKIVQASLKPLIEKKSRKYVMRGGVKLAEFFGEYSKKKFPDRSGELLQVHFNISEGVAINVNQIGFEAAMDNLVRDAINHNKGRPIFVEALTKEGFVTISVYNEGEPIPAEKLAKIGVDAYWSRGLGQLRGYGKVNVKEFCEDHGGKFRAFNMQKDGSHFGPCLQMILPASWVVK